MTTATDVVLVVLIGTIAYPAILLLSVIAIRAAGPDAFGVFEEDASLERDEEA